MSIQFRSGVTTAIVTDGATMAALVRVTSRFADVNGGAVYIDDIDTREWALAALRSTVVVAEHDAVLFENSLRENLLVANRNADDEALLAAMHTAAADDVVDLLDAGLDGAVLERGRSLSGGQRQRVALARAVLSNPPVLVLVDPTSALDSYTEAEIVQRLAGSRFGRTTLVFTSSPALLAAADEVVLIEGGLVLGRGTHGELMSAVASYRSYFAYEGDAS